MAFSSSLEVVNGIARITLSGDLDAGSAQQLRSQVEQASQEQAKRLVLLMKDLNYMASAGLRVLAFAKQKMGAGVDIYMIEVQESVRETIEMTGFHHSVVMLDTYDAEKIEKL